MGSGKPWNCCKCEIPGVRYIFTLMGFLGCCTIYALRVNLNVAIVAMVNGSAVYSDADIGSGCPVNDIDTGNNTSSNSKEGEFNWSSNLQAIVLGSFYLGYCISQIPGGRIAEIYSAKKVFGFGILVAAVFTLFSPVAARWHVYLLIGVRFLEGLAQGVTMPAMHSMLGKWLPESEKGLLSTLIYIGTNIGTVVAMPVSALLCDSGVLGGWPSAFYIFGIFGCFWFLLWMFAVSDTPVRHHWITKKELKYITENQTVHQVGNLPPIPWKAILTSVPFWALIITQFGQDYCFYTLLNDLPTFMSTVLHFDIKTNGYLSALPYVFQTAVGCMVGFVTDALIRKKLATTACVRKFCNTASCVGSALGLVGVCLAGCHVHLTIAMFILSVALNGFAYCGYMLSHLDLSSEYAGTLMGISNTLSNLTGYIAPAIVGALTEKNQTLSQWRIVFYIVIAILAVTCLVFLEFSTTEKQNWVPSRKYTLLDANSDSYSESNYGTLQLGVAYDDAELAAVNDPWAKQQP